MRRLWPAFCGALLLAGCATTRPAPELLPASAQEALLRDLPGFELQGRVAARAGDQGSTPSLSWVQQADESLLRLSGPFGSGGLTVQYSPGSLRVASSRGDEYEGDDAAAILSAQLGLVPPFEALRYWVLGLPAPGEAPTDRKVNAVGRLADLTQLGWHIRYERWTALATDTGAVQVPELLTATRADLRLKLVVDRWKLQAD